MVSKALGASLHRPIPEGLLVKKNEVINLSAEKHLLSFQMACSVQEVMIIKEEERTRFRVLARARRRAPRLRPVAGLLQPPAHWTLTWGGGLGEGDKDHF